MLHGYSEWTFTVIQYSFFSYRSAVVLPLTWYPLTWGNQHLRKYRKHPKYLDTQRMAVIILKFLPMLFYHAVMCPKDDVKITNSVDTGQTWSGSTLFAQTCLSKNLGSLWYS